MPQRFLSTDAKIPILVFIKPPKNPHGRWHVALGLDLGLGGLGLGQVTGVRPGRALRVCWQDFSGDGVFVGRDLRILLLLIFDVLPES